MAGLAVGFWSNKEEIENQWAVDRLFEPVMEDNIRNELYQGWKRAVKATQAFTEGN